MLLILGIGLVIMYSLGDIHELHGTPHWKVRYFKVQRPKHSDSRIDGKGAREGWHGGWGGLGRGGGG